MRVSIVMPMRNAEAHVDAAVRSVLQQREAALELIVIDDASTDASRARVEALQDGRIRLLDGPRRGIAACLNLGLAAARGEVVMRCDADDVYPPGRIARQLAWLDAHPQHAAVCGPFSSIDVAGASIAQLWSDETCDDADIAPELRRGITRTHLCTYAIRRHALQATGGFREYFETGEDIDLALRLGEVGAVGFQAVDSYRYRLHEASITHSQRAARREFFEQTARDFQRQRLDHGEDDLMRGVPPVAPEAGVGHASSAGRQIQGMLVGEAWRALRQHRRRQALGLAWRAIAARPAAHRAWVQLLKIAVRCVVVR